MMTLNKVMLWSVTILAVAFLFFPQYMKFLLAGGSSGETATNNPLVRTTTFSMEGMTCEGCSALVEKAIKEVPGVLSAKVDYERKRAVITSEVCCPDPTEAVINAVQAAGFRASVVELTLNTGTDTTNSKAECDEKGCCAKQSEAAKGRTDAGPINPDRQIIFTVDGFT